MLVRFFLLCYAVTWTLFGAAAWAASRLGPGVPQGLIAQLFVPGAIAPAFVAAWLTYRAQGRAGVRALLRPVLQTDVPVWWYLFAVGYFAAIKLAVAGVHRVLLGGWPRFGQESVLLIAGAIVISTPFQAGEEIGWRGFALPRMAQRMGLRWASVVLGVIWATWHLPLFFVPAADTYRQSFPLYLLQVTALSVAIAWLWAGTRGSLLLPMLMHSAVDQTLGIVPSASARATGILTTRPTAVFLLTALLLWTGAACFLARMPDRKTLRASATAPPASGTPPAAV